MSHFPHNAILAREIAGRSPVASLWAALGFEGPKTGLLRQELIMTHRRHRAFVRHATVSPVDHSQTSGRCIASQGLRAPTPRPFHGDQGSLRRSLWNPSTRAWRSASPSGLNHAPTVHRLDAVSVSPLDQDHGKRPWVWFFR